MNKKTLKMRKLNDKGLMLSTVKKELLFSVVTLLFLIVLTVMAFIVPVIPIGIATILVDLFQAYRVYCFYIHVKGIEKDIEKTKNHL